MLLRSRNRLRKEFWFINAGTLSDSAYKNAFVEIKKISFTEVQLSAVIFLGIDYLVQYFELLSINFSNLLNNCIKRHLIFIEKLLSISKYKTRFISSLYLDAIFTISDKFENTEDYIEKQFCIDAFERICNFLTSKARFWVRTTSSLTFLKVYGRKGRDAVVYNSFLIPNFSQYKDPLTDPDQKLFEKIENECFCKIQLNVNSSNCRIGKQSMILEVIFDYYKGNFLGFLDNISYLVKRISPTKHFIKSLRTIKRTESMHFTIISDLPFHDLRLMEKVMRMGDLIPPFLHSAVVSKQAFQVLIADIKNLVEEELEQILMENEELKYWGIQLSEADISKYKEMVLNFISSYQCWILLLKQWSHYKENNDKIPLQNLRLSEVFHLESLEENITEVTETSEHESVTIEEKSTASFPIKTVRFPNENFTKKDVNPNTLKVLTKKYSSSRLSTRFSKIDNLKRSSYTNILLDECFKTLYNRKFKMEGGPRNVLNHTLRVILRCNTNFQYGDSEISKLQSGITINDLLKKYYNYNLITGNHYSYEERKKSFLVQQGIQNEKGNPLVSENRGYLENRKIISEEIENVDDDNISLAIESKVYFTDSDSHDNIIINNDILFNYTETKEHITPKFKKELFTVFGELNTNILQLFNEKRINELFIWNDKIKGDKKRFNGIFPLYVHPISCDSVHVYKAQIHPDQIDMIYSSVSTNIYITFKILSRNDPLFDEEFTKMYKGKGMQINFLNEINSCGNLPKMVFYMDNRKSVYRMKLNHLLCILSFDIYLICASLSSAIGNLFDYHRQELETILESESEEVKDLYKLFEFEEKFNEARALFKFRLQNRSNEEIGTLLKLSQNIRRFNDFLFHSSCCKWQEEKCIRIIYVSMIIDGNKKCQEPFLRRGGDRRLKKIETKGSCMITMKLTTNPITGVDIPFLEIFYDFFKGNHFCVMDMLKNMLIQNYGSRARMLNTKYLLCLPYGELWLLQDVEWLRTRATVMLATHFSA